MTFTKRPIVFIILTATLLLLLSACGDREESASQTTARELPNPEGRIVTANQNADNLTVIDVATNQPYATIPTGKQPHHVLATPDWSELWVTLYGENRLQIISSETLKEIGSVWANRTTIWRSAHRATECTYRSATVTRWP
jgi:YVTN family beta-propeller protein